MASDSICSPSEASFRQTTLNLFAAAYDAGRVPGFSWSRRFSHWVLRVPLAGIMLTYGAQKIPDMFIAPGSYGVPAALFVLAGLAELLGAVALVFGGVIETWRPARSWLRLSGDALTRIGASAGVSAALGVIVFFYWGAVSISDPQVLMLAMAAYLLLRGNQ